MLYNKVKKLVPYQLHPILGDILYRCRGMIFLMIAKGNSYSCSVCNHSFSKFLPAGLKYSVLQKMKIVGGGYRKNVECPYCGSLDRERLVDIFLKSRSLLQPEMQLLHIAPEKNIQKMIRQKHVNAVFADLDSPLADVRMNIQQIQFPNNFFDAIICNHVLEHIPDDGLAMKELFRVLKPGGWAILQVPYSPLLQQSLEDPSVILPKDRIKVFGQSDHVRIYGLDYPSRLRSAGFVVSAEKMDAEITKQFALNPEEVIFFCKK